MNAKLWGRWLARLFNRGPARKQRRVRPRTRLVFEPLEDRLTPTTYTWTGLGGSANWSVAANWQNDAAPTAGGDLVFGTLGTTKATVDNISGLSINSLTFSASGYSVTLATGDAAPTLVGGITVDPAIAGTDTLSLPMTLKPTAPGLQQTFSATAASTLDLAGSITGSESTQTINLSGAGTIEFAGNNSAYTGAIATTSNSGVTLLATNSNALGLGNSGTTTVAAGTQLELSAPSATSPLNIDENLILNGSGISNSGALVNIQGNNTWSGPVTMDSNSMMAAVSGTTMTVSGQIGDSGAQSVTINNSTGYVNGVLGAGTVVFAHAGGDTYHGQTIIDNGILAIQDPLSLGAGATFGTAQSNTIGAETIVNYTINTTSQGPAVVSEGTLELDFLNQTTNAQGVTTGIGSSNTTGPTPGTDPNGILQNPGEVWNNNKTSSTYNPYVGFQVFNDILVLNGPGYTPTAPEPLGALYNLAGDNAWDGTVTLGSPSTATFSTGDVYIGVNGATTTTVNGVTTTTPATALTISGAVSSTTPLAGTVANLDKVGGGTLVANDANPYFYGNTNVFQGAVNIGDSQALGINTVTGGQPNQPAVKPTVTVDPIYGSPASLQLQVDSGYDGVFDTTLVNGIPTLSTPEVNGVAVKAQTHFRNLGFDSVNGTGPGQELYLPTSTTTGTFTLNITAYNTTTDAATTYTSVPVNIASYTFASDLTNAVVGLLQQAGFPQASTNNVSVTQDIGGGGGNIYRILFSQSMANAYVPLLTPVTAPAVVGITGVSQTGTTVTVTTSSPLGALAVGQKVTIAGIAPAGYSGTVTVTSVSGNQFQFTAAANLGAATLTSATATSSLIPVVDDNPIYGLTVANPLNLTAPPGVPGDGVVTSGGGAGALNSISGLNTYTGAIAISGNVQAIGVEPDTSFAVPVGLTVDAGQAGHFLGDSNYLADDYSLTVSGVISGGTGTTMAKVGLGDLILPAGTANTYTGPNNIEQGWVTAENNYSLGSPQAGVTQTVQSYTTVDAGASLMLDAPAAAAPGAQPSYLTLSNNFVLAGTGLSSVGADGSLYGLLPQEGAIENINGNNLITGIIQLEDVQAVTIPPGASGSFTLAYNGTATTALKVSDPTLAADMQAALNKLSTIESIGLSVTVSEESSGVYAVQFNGLTAGNTPSLMTATNSVGVAWESPGIGVEQIFPAATTASALPNSQLNLVGPLWNYVGANSYIISANPTAPTTLIQGGITKLGSRRLVIESPGTYTGSVNIVSGVLLDQSSTGLGAGQGDPSSPSPSPQPTVTVQSGAALELGNTATILDNTTATGQSIFSTTYTGGIEEGVQVAGEGLVLNGNGDPTFGDSSLTVLASNAATTGPDVQTVAVTPGGTFSLTYDGYAATLSATITGVTETGTTATATMSTALTGLVAGEDVTLSGVSPAGYDGTFTVTSVTGNQFTFTAPAGLGAGTATDATATLSVFTEGLTSVSTLEAALDAAAPLAASPGGYATVTQSGNVYLFTITNPTMPSWTVAAVPYVPANTDNGAFPETGYTEAGSTSEVLAPFNDGLVSSDDLWEGPVSLDSNTTITVPANSRLIVTGNMGNGSNVPVAGYGGSGLTVTGGGEVDLDGANGYSGTTYVDQGVLTAGNNQALGAGGSPEVETVTLTGVSQLPSTTPTTYALTFTTLSGQVLAPMTFEYTGNSSADVLAIENTFDATLAGIEGDGGGTVTATESTAVINSVPVATITVTFGGALNGFQQNLLGSTIVSGPGSIAVAQTDPGEGGTMVAAGASLQLSGSITIAGEPLIVQGTGSLNAVQTITVSPSTTSGTMYLTFTSPDATGNTVSDVAGLNVASLSAAEIQANLSALGNIGGVNGTVAVVGEAAQAIAVPLGQTGTFTLAYGSSVSGPLNLASPTLASDIQSALNAMTSISSVGGSVTVTNTSAGVYTVTFGGSFASTTSSQPVVQTLAPGGAASGVTVGDAGVIYTVVFGGALAGKDLPTMTASSGVPALVGPVPVVTTTQVGDSAAQNIPTQWFQVGPSTVDNGQTTGSLPVAGTVTAIAVDPNDPNTIYIGTADGGVWKTIDDGAHWYSIFNSIPEIQTITVNTSGTFTLSFGPDSTATLSGSDPNLGGDIQDALNALGTIGGVGGIATVFESGSTATSTTFEISFGGSMSGYSESRIQLTVGATSTPATVIQIGTGSDSSTSFGSSFALYIGAITINPEFPNIIYVGTGVGDNSPDSYYGTGIYESQNFGITWSLLLNNTANNPGVAGNPFYGKVITSMQVDPQSIGNGDPGDLVVSDGDYSPSTDEVQDLTFYDVGGYTLSLTAPDQTGEEVTDTASLYVGEPVAEIDAALDAFTNIGGVGGYVTVVQTDPFRDDIAITFQGTLSNTTLPAVVTDIPTPLESSSPPWIGVTVTNPNGTSISNGGGLYAVGGSVDVNGTTGVAAKGASAVGISSPGIWVSDPLLGTWYNVTSTVSPDRRGIASTNDGDPIYGPNGVTPGEPSTLPGPEDNYQIFFPQTNATWSDVEIVTEYDPSAPDDTEEVMFAALGTPDIGQAAMYNSVTGVIEGYAENGVYWSTNFPNFNPDPPLPGHVAVSNVQNIEWYSGNPWVGNIPGDDEVYTPDNEAAGSFISVVDPAYQGVGTPEVPGDDGPGSNVNVPEVGSIKFSAVSGGTWSEEPGLLEDYFYGNFFGNGEGANDGFVTIYASVTTAGGELMGVYVSTDGGMDWAATGSIPEETSVNGLTSPATTDEGQYDNAIWVDPSNPQVIVIGGQVSTGDVADQSGQIYMSIDGGGTWNDVSNLLDPAGASVGTHDSQHAIVLDPGNGNLLFGNDGGIWQLQPNITDAIDSEWVGGASDNGDLNGDLPTSEVLSVASDPTTYSGITSDGQNTTVASIAYNGTAGYGSDGANWSVIDDDAGGEMSGSQVFIDPQDANVIYSVQTQLGTATTGNGTSSISDTSNTGSGAIIRESDDGGNTWTTILSDNIATNVNGTYPVATNELPLLSATAPMEMDQINPNRLLVGGGVTPGLYETGDATVAANGGTVSWTNIGGNLPITVSAIGLAEYQGAYQQDSSFPLITDQGANAYVPNTIYATNGTNVYVTMNDGKSWVERDSGLTSAITSTGTGQIAELVVDPRNMYTVYAVVNGFNQGEVYVSYNAGKTWTQIGAANGLPNVPAWSLVVDPRNGNLYVGTDIGVFTIQGGANLPTASSATPLPTGAWQPFGFGMPSVQVRDLVLNPITNTLLAATYGEGVFELFLDGAETSAVSTTTVPAIATSAVTGLSGANVWTGPVSLAGTAGSVSIVSASETGTTVTITTATGMNLAVGESIVVDGLAPTGFDGIFTVVSVSGDQFTYTAAIPGLGTSTTAGAAATENIVALGAYGIQNLPEELNDGSVNIVGPISDLTLGSNLGLEKVGGGDVILSGTNIYGGPTAVLEGNLVVDNYQALGAYSAAGDNTATVEIGAALEFESNLGPVPITLNGDGAPLDDHNTGALRNISGDNIFLGSITLGMPGTLDDTVTIDADSGSMLTITGDVGGLVTGESLVKEGLGTIALAGQDDYIGDTYVYGGALQAQSTSAFSTGSVTAVDGAQVQVQSPQALVVSATSGTFSLSFTGSNAAGSVVTDTTGLLSVISATLGSDIAAALVKLANIGGVGGTVNVVQVASGVYAITFGGTLVGDDAQQVKVVPGAPAPAGGTVAVEPASLSIGNSLILSGTGLNTGILDTGALLNTGGDNTWTGPIALGVNPGFSPNTFPAGQVAIGAATGSTLTIASPVSDLPETGSQFSAGNSQAGVFPQEVGIDKVGGGTVVLEGADTFSGGVTVTAGDLVAANSGALGTHPSADPALATVEQIIMLSPTDHGQMTIGFDGKAVTTGYTSVGGAAPTAQQMAITLDGLFASAGFVGVNVEVVETAIETTTQTNVTGLATPIGGELYTVTFTGSLTDTTLLLGATGIDGTAAGTDVVTAGGEDVYVSYGAELDLSTADSLTPSSNMSFVGHTITLNGSGLNGNGAFQNTSGDNLWNGSIIIQTGATSSTNASVGATSGSSLTIEDSASGLDEPITFTAHVPTTLALGGRSSQGNGAGGGSIVFPASVAFSGQVIVTGGDVQVDSTAFSNVPFELDGGAVSGLGTVGAITNAPFSGGGIVNPGDNADSALVDGVLTFPNEFAGTNVTKTSSSSALTTDTNLTLSSADTFDVYVGDPAVLNTAPNSSSMLMVDGNLTIEDAIVSGYVNPYYEVGDTPVTIIQTTGTVVGTFLNEGTTTLGSMNGDNATTVAYIGNEQFDVEYYNNSVVIVRVPESVTIGALTPVVPPGAPLGSSNNPPVDQQETIAFTDANGTAGIGFTLSFNGTSTGTLTYSPGTDMSQTLIDALDALTTIGGVSGSVTVSLTSQTSTVSVYTVTFGGTLSGTAEPAFGFTSGSGLTIAVQEPFTGTLVYGEDVQAEVGFQTSSFVNLTGSLATFQIVTPSGVPYQFNGVLVPVAGSPGSYTASIDLPDELGYPLAVTGTSTPATPYTVSVYYDGTFTNGTQIFSADPVADGTVVNFPATEVNPALNVSITPATTTTTLLTKSGAPAISPPVPGSGYAYGTSLTFTATVTSTLPAADEPVGLSPPVPSGYSFTPVTPPQGVVAFYDTPVGGTLTLLGYGNVSANGTATFTSSTLGEGIHSITAVYEPNSSPNLYLGSSTTTNPDKEKPIGFTIDQATTSTGLTISPATIGYDGQTLLTATVTSSGAAPPVGDVTFQIGGVVLATVPVSTAGPGESIATYTTQPFQIPADGGAVQTVIASFSGNGNFAASQSTVAQGALTVNPIGTIASVGSSLPGNSFAGQLVTFTATVLPNTSVTGYPYAAPTGTVTFDLYNAGDQLIATATEPVSTSSGLTTATYSTTQLPVGADSVTAVYNGDAASGGDYNASPTSSALPQTVDQATTQTSLTATPTSVVASQAVTLTATVIATTGGAAVGTVDFYDYGNGTTTANLLGGATLDANGVGTIQVTLGTPDGTHDIVAVFTGNTSFATSPSSPGATTTSPASDGTDPTPVTVVPNGTRVSKVALTTSQNPITLGNSVTLTATVQDAGSGAAQTPTGTVTFVDATTGATLGVGTLTGAGGTATATLTTAAFAQGVNNLIATYGGNIVFAAESSSVVAETVDGTGVSTVTVTSSSTLSGSVYSSTYGQAVTFTATVAGQAGQPPLGSVTFDLTNATTGLITQQTVTLPSTTSTTDKVTYKPAALAVGTYTVTASYSGNINYLPEQSSSITQDVTPIASTISLTGTKGTYVYGQKLTYTATVKVTGATPAGTVMFYDANSGAVLATVAVKTKAGVSTAVWTTKTLAPGSYSVYAVFNSDNGNVNNSPNSTVFAVTINQDAVKVALAASTTTQYAPVTFTATITPVSPGKGTPTGTVTFYTSTGILLGTAVVGANGKAKLTVQGGFGPGYTTIIADYSGDDDFMSGSKTTTYFFVVGRGA